MRVSDLTHILNQIAPWSLAEEWDNVGLQAGDPRAEVRRVMTCLEATDAVIDEAVAARADALVAHHPLIFRPLKAIHADRPIEGRVARLLREGIAFFAAHTNLDRTPDGVNGALAAALGLERCATLLPDASTPGAAPHVKLVVYTPAGHESAIIEAIHRGGGGTIGAYDHCTFRAPGVGTFRGDDSTNPAIGERGQLESVEELRLETVVRKSRLAATLDEVIAAHPYEEVAYDVFPMLEPAERPDTGLGQIGELPAAEPFDAFLKRAASLPDARPTVIGARSESVQRVAVMGGSAGSTLTKFLRQSFDVLVTGELNHHAAAEIVDAGRCVVCVGHFASERPIAARLAALLAERVESRGESIEIRSATSERDPIQAG